MSSLYDINNEILNCIDLETGEILDLEKLDKLELQKKEKIENIALWYKNLNYEAEAIKKERSELEKREKSIRNKVESLQKYLINALGGEKFETARVKISYRKSERINIENIFDIDEKYLRVSSTINKDKIREDIKKGIEVRGVKVIENRNIIIR